MAKKAADSYIQLKKKITNRFQINQIEILCENWGLSAQEVCYKLIFDGIHREIKSREYIDSLKRSGN